MSRSVRIHEFGGPEVLKIEDIVVPVPESGEVRLRVRAIGLNRSEVAAVTPPLPSLMGLEAAGEVDAVGPRGPD
jgi:NADPH:quinone reductase-like Zn-dependent oxidoreductase